MRRVETLCWWIGFAIYLFSAYLLFRVLQQFPEFYREHADVIWSVAWLPLGIMAFWTKGKIEDWVIADNEADAFLRVPKNKK
jgi:hypothetical protein